MRSGGRTLPKRWTHALTLLCSRAVFPRSAHVPCSHLCVRAVLIGALDAKMKDECTKRGLPCVSVEGDSSTTSQLKQCKEQNIRACPQQYPKMSILKVTLPTASDAPPLLIGPHDDVAGVPSSSPLRIGPYDDCGTCCMIRELRTLSFNSHLPPGTRTLR
jgi:hypothetical protein